ncbi:non-canonical purine NTP diphosphatase [Ascidiimonas sp. W6]|uniref:non-canonical purine NTP diphosphatase n=1 Tax=Ascidiimonas meishanensis TaxID=3128903 RepID=UPI0030EC5DA6
MELVFATHNKNKLIEVKALLPHSFTILSLTDIGCDEEIEETGQTIEENAIIKANYVTEKYGYDCFADDSGLEVKALNGAPGVLSARYAGNAKSTEANNQLLLKNLNGVSLRKARFKTVIALNLQNTKVMFHGIINGTILQEQRGKGGFGYDPLFLPDGYDKTFAELPLTVKNEISHRAKAMHQLIDYLK